MSTSARAKMSGRRAARSLIQRHEDIPAFEQRLRRLSGRSEPTAGAAGETDRASPRSARAVEHSMRLEHAMHPTASRFARGATSTDIATKDFAELTAERARACVSSALARLTWNLDERRTRRWVAGPRQPHRSAARAGAQPAHRRRDHDAAAPAPAHPPPADRAAVRRQRLDGALHADAAAVRAHAVARHARVEAFLFATRLTRITMELRAPKPDAAMAAVSRAVKDWSGGTRIGDALRSFHQRWRRRTLHGSSVVILISDGWDRGDPRAAARRDRAAAAQLPPADLAEPADRHDRLRAADARAAGGAAVRRRFPAGAHAA